MKNNMIFELDNVKLWTGSMEIEQEATEQIYNMSRLPILAGHIAIMPDVHYGKGATVGSVIPTRNAVIPAAVGVDIGCGMCAAMTNLKAEDLPENLFSLRNQLEKSIPVGFNEHKKGIPSVSGPYADVLRKNLRKTMEDFESLILIDKLGRHDISKVSKQVGTLGGGNHFIELCLDKQNRVWIMLHSGSRNIGNQIGQIAIEMAKGISRDWQLADRNLAWLDEGTKEFEAYIQAMYWAQDYARFNRDTMMNIILSVMKVKFPKLAVLGEIVNCHHNYTSVEEHFDEKMWVTRKGAVSAKTGQLGIIPGSMGAKSFIVRGKGHQDAYCSCSHGAGRIMSRNKAKQSFNLDDLAQQTSGVECRKDGGVIDEIPAAYKNIDDVMEAQTDLVDVVHTLKQILCIKG